MSNLVVYFSLLLARVGTFIAILPILGGQTVPRLVKMGLALSLTCMWFGSTWNSPTVAAWLLQPVQTSSLGLGLALGREALLGALLGYAFGLFLIPARIAGEYLNQELGLSFGNLINPTGTTSTGPLTQIFDLLGTLIFLGLDGHHIFLAVLNSFVIRFPGGGVLPEVPVQLLVAGAAAAEEWGLLMVAPLALCLFLTSVVLALMARAAPQINIFAVGFPLRLTVGLVGLWLMLPTLVTGLVAIFGASSEWMQGLVP